MKRTLGVCLPASFQRESTEQERPTLDVHIITMCRGPSLYLKRKKVTDRLSTNIQTSPGPSRFEQAASRAYCHTLSWLIHLGASSLMSLQSHCLLTHADVNKQPHEPAAKLTPDPSTYEQTALSDCCHTVSSAIVWTLSKWCEKNEFFGP